MRKTSRYLALLLALVMCVSLVSAGAWAAEGDIEIGDMTGKVVIIHTNDTHGRDKAGSQSYGTAAVAQLKKDYEAAGADVLLLSAGDAMQGLPLVNQDMGASAIEFMSAAGYDMMAPGNHEFDFGFANLLSVLDNYANFPALSANILYAADNTYGKAAGEPVFDANKIFDLGGLKVGVFGLTTPETYTKAHPDKVKGVEFLMDDELYEAAQEQVDYLTGEGCEIIICVGHMGDDASSAPNRSVDIIENVSGIDLFVDGHSHTSILNGREEDDKDGNTTLLVSAFEQLKTIGIVVYDPAEDTLTASTLALATAKNYSGLDEDVNELVNNRDAVVEEELKEVIGSTEILLYGKNTVDPLGVRVAETNLGDFATDALLWAARQELGEENVDLALTNGGGIRDNLPNVAKEVPADLTMKDMVTVFPFGNVLSTVEVTGAELLEALEASCFSAPVSPLGGFPQVSGVEFTIAAYVPFERGELYPSSTYYKPANPGERIRDVMVGGEPLDLDRTYVVATNDFTAAGGDTYLVFKNKTTVNLGVPMEQALINYMSEELGGVVGEEYAGPQGRIDIKFPDVNSTEWYAEAVKAAIDGGIMPNGMGDNAWMPDGKVTVAMIFETLYNLEGSPAVFGENFPDIATGDWFMASALWAKVNGLSAGDNNGNYNGNRYANRAEFMQIFVNYIEYKTGTTLPIASLDSYTDASEIPSWLKDGMGKAVRIGLAKGNGDGTLNPLGDTTRAHLAQIHFNLVSVLDNLYTAEGVVAELIYGGNLQLDIAGKALFDRGFEIGDIITVTVGNTVLDMPFCKNYNDVDIMGNLVRLSGGREDAPVIVAVNMSAFAKAFEGAVGDTVEFALKEKGGYLDELNSRLTESGRTNVLSDYESEEVFANFREIVMGDIAPGVLYRSSSPVNNELGRAEYADEFCEEAGIKTVLNLADTTAKVDGFLADTSYSTPYYKSLYEAGGVIPLGMGVDFFYDTDNIAKLKDGIEFMLANEGPYLVHCTEGKDRAGFVSAMLEAFMGATLDEITADYMQTYINYFHFEAGTAGFDKFANSTIHMLLCYMAEVPVDTDLSTINLADAAADYLLGIGLTATQLDDLYLVLSGGATTAAVA